MSKRIISRLASWSVLSVFIVPMAIADSIEAPAKRNIAPEQRVASYPADNRRLEIADSESPALAENSDSEPVRSWSDIWE